MGCDIHPLVERRINGKWVTVNTLGGFDGPDGRYCFPAAQRRNYRRFAMLAGVRGDGPSPRGLPDDVSETAEALAAEYGPDGHSHSWVELDEACRIFLASEYKEPEPDSFQARFPAHFYFSVEEGQAEDARLVFWFDN